MSESTAISVALLSDRPSHNEHLRAALDALGAAIAYESVADTFDRAALERSGAQVVIVNLDDGDNSEFDEVYDLLDDDRYRVLINDAGVTSALSGWDQARWMRHLAAKMLGSTDINPPRPADAEAVPELVVDAGHDMQAESSDEPVAAAAAEPMLALEPEAVPEAEPVAEPPHATEADWSIELESAVAAEPPAAAGLVDAAGDAALAVPDLAPADEDNLLAFDLDELLDAPAPPATSGGAALLEPDAASELPAADEEVIIELSSGDADPAHGMELELDELAFDEAAAIPAAPPALAPEPAAAAPASDEADADASALLGDLDLDLDFDAPPPPVQLEAPGDVLHSSGDAGQWSIDELLDDVLAPPPVHPDEEVKVDKMSAAEFLAPDVEEGGVPLPTSSGGLSLELVPLEESVAPVAFEKASHETWLDPDSAAAAKVRRVWVLGASIGGPEAVRSFLAALPRDYPALFLVAQHLGDEYVETMTRQLARAVAMPVRAPAHGERASHGEVLIVPNDRQLLVDARGVVVLRDLDEPGEYRPSIDRVLGDVAQRFGPGAGAIIFSGMSEDAAAGCREVAAAGGRVYVQSPDSCVVSTMVEGVLETGVVQFEGTPEELAARLAEEPAGA